MKRTLFGLVLLGAFSFCHAAEPVWIQHYEWAKHNRDGVEPHDGTILELAPNCFATGKHPSCLWSTARDAAKANQCDRALRLMKEAQGHNGGAQAEFEAHKNELCERLKKD